MAGDASWKGSLAVGPLLRFEVKAQAAVREQKVGGFNMHHGGCDEHGSLKQSYSCSACGETNLSRADSIPGYQGIMVDGEAWKRLAAERTDTIEIDAFVDAGSIDARWVQKSYDLIPADNAVKVYALIYAELEDEGQIGIGKIVMRGYEYIVAIRPRAGVLAMELCYWPEEVDATGSLTAARDAIAKAGELSDKERGMGKALIGLMHKDWQPETYVNEVAARKAEYLAQVVEAGEDVTIPQITASAPAVASLEDALAASLAAMGATAKAESKAKSKGKGKAA